MRHSIYFLIAVISLFISRVNCADAAIVTYDWSTNPEAPDFDDKTSASTTVDGVTLSADVIMSFSQFNISSAFGAPQSLGARGIGSQDNFDGEAGFTFSFDAPGTLKSITLEAEGSPGYALHTPHDGVHSYNADFSNESFSFLAGEVFTFAHNFGSYRVGTIVINAVPEPGSLTLLALGMLSITIARRHRRVNFAPRPLGKVKQA